MESLGTGTRGGLGSPAFFLLLPLSFSLSFPLPLFLFPFILFRDATLLPSL